MQAVRKYMLFIDDCFINPFIPLRFNSSNVDNLHLNLKYYLLLDFFLIVLILTPVLVFTISFD